MYHVHLEQYINGFVRMLEYKEEGSGKTLLYVTEGYFESGKLKGFGRMIDAANEVTFIGFAVANDGTGVDTMDSNGMRFDRYRETKRGVY